jgi:UDP-N-acetylenolpyruvoylglucosamine reductase
MARHCSFRVGGIAQDFFIPDTLNALSDFLKNNQQPILMLGLGSNLLVRDRGFSGVVIKLLIVVTDSTKDQISKPNAPAFIANAPPTPPGMALKNSAQQDIQDLLKKRNDSQPIGEANCGSVFKNPPNNFAAKLIEDSDLKGFCMGVLLFCRQYQTQ